MSFEYIVRTYGYLGLFLGTFFEGETILIVGGFTAHLGYLKLPGVMLFAFLGAFSGDQLFFFIGRYKDCSLLTDFRNYRFGWIKFIKLSNVTMI